MTQHRTGLFWALFAAILAMLLCSVGVAEGSTDELSLDGVPESVTLYTDTASPHVSPSGTLRFKAAFKDSNSTISDLKVTLEPKGANDAIIGDITIDARPNGDKKVWWVYISYSPVSVGASEYTLTAFTPDNEDCRISKDIAFTVAESDPDLPASIDVNPEYFGESNIYSREIVLKENESQVTLDSVHELFPTYSINGQNKACTILTVEDSGFMYRGDSFIFSKTGKFTVKFATNEAGSNWELYTALIFVVTDGSEPSKPEEAPTAPPVITGIPDEDTLVAIDWRMTPQFTLKAEESPFDVFWNVSCDNPQIVLDHSGLSGNELKLWAWGNTDGVSGTVTVKAWYNGYDDKVAIETFKVHTEMQNAKKLILDKAPDEVTLSMETRNEGDLIVHRNPEMWLFVTYDDYSNITDLEQPTFTLKSGSDVLKNISVESCFDKVNNRWRIIIRYNAATTGTGVYSLYARVPNGGPSISKDITFNVVDRIDDLPTKFNISSDYFDESKVYKTVLEMPEDGSELIFNFPNEANPTYTRGDKVYNAGFDVISPIYWRNGNLIFKKAGRYPLGLVVAPNGSNWQLHDKIYFVVHSSVPPKNPTPTLTDVPEDDMLISRSSTNITIKSTDLEQTVNWEVTCDNTKIHYNEYDRSSADESTLSMNIWCSEAGVTGTFTVKAWYEGYAENAAVKTFKVHTKATEFVIYNVPDTVTLYMNRGKGRLFAVAKLNDNTPIEKVDFTLMPKDTRNALLENLEIQADRQGDNIGCVANMYYTAKATGTCVYTFTATVPETNYSVSKDITFTIVDGTDDLPTKFNISSDYFDENKVYKTVLEMPADGSELAFSLPDEAKPTYTIGGNTYAANFNFISPIDWRKGNLIFKKAGRYQLGLVAAPNGSNWQLRDTVHFVVHSNIPPKNPTPTLTGVPEDDMLISRSSTNITIKSTDLEQTVNWEVTCDNTKIHYNEYDRSSADESTLSMNIWCSEAGVTGTFTVKAWYEGYAENAAVKTFKVHTEEKAIILHNAPDAVTLSMETRTEGDLTVHENPNMWVFVLYNDYSKVTDLEQPTFTFKSGSDVLKNIRVESCFDNNNDRWRIIIRYDAATTGTGVYSLYACVPNGGPSISKDITFTVVDRIDDLPTEFNISPDYFDENKVYKTVLEMPEDGSELVFNFSNEAHPTYTRGDKVYNAGFDVISPIDWHDGLVFKKAGRYQLGLIAAPNGSNWQLHDKIYFVVHSNVLPKNPTPTLIGVPEGDVLLGDDTTNITITATNLEQMVNWEVTCNNGEIEVNHWTDTSDDESNLEIRLWGNSTGLSGTVTVKAWYEGYEDDAAIKTFNVHTKEHTFTLSDAPDTVTSYMVDGLPGIDDFGCIHISAFFDDYVSIDKVKFELTKVSGDDIVDFDIDDADSDPDERTSWWINWSYRPIALGTCVYNITASIPGTEYTASKDITFIVTDNADGLPTKLNFSSEYFDDNNVYKGELIISANGSPAVISNVRNLFPTYEFNGITKDCDISNRDGFDYYYNSFHFSKAGTYNVGFSSAEYGSNFELQEYATFIVTSEVPLNNPTPTLTGVPEDDVLLGDDGANVTITATNLEQMVNWEVTCSNAEIEVSHWTDTYDDESNLEIGLWANSAGISGTVTVKAWYDGHKDDAAVATFDVYVENRLILDGIPETITLYKGGNSGGAAVSDTATLEFICYFADDTYPENVDVTFTRKSEQGNLIKSYEFNNTYSFGIIKYATADISDGIYELTATTLDGEYTASCDIEFIVNSATEELPSYFEFDPKYFNDGHVYCHDELVMPADGSPLEITFLWENHPKYTLNGEKRSCSIDVNGTGIMFGDYDVWMFPAAGTYEVKCFAAPNGSNWELADKAYFVVKPYVDPDPVDPWPPYTPVEDPTAEPTLEPTAEPTAEPTLAPTAEPTAEPTPTPAPIKEVTTGGKNLKVRLNPGTGAVVAKLPDGTRLEVLGTENGWSRIRATMPDGSVVEGFVMDDYLSDVEPTATATAQPGAATTPAPLPSGEPTPVPSESAAKVNTSGSALRLRSDPSTSSDVLVRMPNGADVTILETVDGWTRIRFVAQNGKEYEGWASSAFIKADERPAPTATPAPTAVPAPTATPAPNSGARVDAGGKKLKLRRQPGSSGSGVTTKIPDGAELIVLEYGEEWSLCSYNGVTGYCATAYLKFN